MLDILHPYFNIENFGSKAKLIRKQNKPNYIYLNDLDKKKSSTQFKKRDSKFPESIPLIHKEKEVGRGQNHGRGDHDHEGREGVKVKILMTKEEAARLLSKCKVGGVLEFKDVACELVQIPASRVCVATSGMAEDRVLGSIPEESSTTT